MLGAPEGELCQEDDPARDADEREESEPSLQRELHLGGLGRVRHEPDDMEERA